MSLYGGIAFDGNKPKEVTPVEAAAPSTPAAADTPAAPTGSSDQPKPTWSAALRFAPTIRKRPTPSAARAVPLAFKSAFNSAEDAVASPSAPRIVGKAKAPLSAATISAPPTTLPPSATIPTLAASTPAPEPVFATRQGRILKPPAMTLDADDVNGFRQTTVGKKAAQGGGKKGKGKKNNKAQADPMLAFTAVTYDPARPCDYSAYKIHVQVSRAQRRNASYYPPPPPPPQFYPASSSTDHSPSFTPPLLAGPQPPPGFFAPPQGFDPAAGGPQAPTVQLSEAAAKARDIAQRLSKLAGLQPPTPPVVESASPALPAELAEPDNRPFADRMMSKFGWTEGKGLGADESGMTAALSVSKAKTPSTKKGKGGKQQDAPPPPVGMAGGAKGRATIVDSSRESRLASQTAQVGEPSRVVLLTNLCGIDDVDDDLGGEVAEEANKFGVVERCFVYLVPGETRDDEGVRIFLVMSGLAGGWNAVRQFDGRFFGGRVVKARFYDEGTFNAGEHRV
ncbi:hypothetical protein RQP46_003855 [Phenoliferia psychrophenolica]